MIVAIEGIDGSGKETQVRLLKRWALKNRKEMGLNEVSLQDFPDYTSSTGQRIYELLHGKWFVITDDPADKQCLKALLLQTLQLANRCEHGERLQRFANDPFSLLLLDRYYASGFVYGESDGLSRSWLEGIHYLLPKPDLWILVDISVDESFKRRPERTDYYEKDRARQAQVRDLYLDLFKRRRDSEGEHWIVIDGAGSVDDVHLRILDPVRGWLRER